MKLLFSLVAISTILFTTSCDSSKTVSTVEFNDTIVDEQDKVVTVIQKYYDDESLEYSDAEKLCQDIVNQCDSSIQRVAALPKLEGSDEYKAVALKMFEYYKKLSKNEFLEIAKIMAKEDYTDEEYDHIMELNDKIELESGKFDLDLESAQAKFAAAHNYEVEQ